MTILSGDHANVSLFLLESLTLTADSTTRATGSSPAVKGAGSNGVIVKGDVGVASVAMDFAGTNNRIAVTSTGSVEGVDTAIRLASSSGVAVTIAGTVSAGFNGVQVQAGGGNTSGGVFVVSGTLIGGASALQLADGNDRVVNTGTMLGSVGLGAGDDLFDSSLGVYGNGSVDGGAGDDTLTGSAYADLLLGGADADELWGNAGNDTLDGGSGADELHGGAGFDLVRYSGTAAVVASLATPALNTGLARGDSYDSIEGLTGGARADRLSGNDLRNRLDGGAGADTLSGGAGNDAYIVDDAGDRVVELGNGGTDTIYASVSYSLGYLQVENLRLRGSTGLEGRGNGLDNDIVGSSGADTLSGALGDDTLTGGAGFDQFLFNAALGSGNVDTLVDFDRSDDVIWLKRSVFTTLGGAGTHLPSGEFRLGTKAVDSNDHILYDSASGALRYDADGSGAGAAVLFALLEPGTALTASDLYGVV